MDLGNPVKALVHHLLIEGMTCLGCRDEFPMVIVDGGWWQQITNTGSWGVYMYWIVSYIPDLHPIVIYIRYWSAVGSLEWNVKSTSKLDSKGANTSMGLSGPRSKLTYHNGTVYKIGSRFILLHKGILVISQGYTWNNEQESTIASSLPKPTLWSAKIIVQVIGWKILGVRDLLGCKTITHKMCIGCVHGNRMGCTCGQQHEGRDSSVFLGMFLHRMGFDLGTSKSHTSQSKEKTKEKQRGKQRTAAAVFVGTFGALPEVHFLHAIYHFKAQEVKNPTLQTVYDLELKQGRYGFRKTTALDESHEDLDDGLAEPMGMNVVMSNWRQKLVILPLFKDEEEMKEPKDAILKLELKTLLAELKKCNLCMPYWIRDQEGRLVRIENPQDTELDICVNIMDPPPEDQNSQQGQGGNPNAYLSMRDRMHPPRMSAPSSSCPLLSSWYMEAINACPHHGLIHGSSELFYDGMSSSMKQILETMCGGDFMSKNPEEAMDFLSYVAEVSRGWDEPNSREKGKFPSQQTQNPKAGMYMLSEDWT
ncbi:hypothetical protein CK203_051346 [Vitis vinifera]|uniref:Uncharacterized protein n=1 Tax=Vitis vinifera TaxID=29760 RepID=A0A438FLW7_VITVI|nr:hypothetical protein CK203_051346 [Vitis vinifera]